MDDKLTAIIFAGQGSQYIGMGKDFYDKYEYVQKMYDIASSTLGYDLKSICFEDNNLINLTKYTQPAMLVTSCVIYEVLKKEFSIDPVVVSGFSLGEYTALYASGVFSFEDVVSLVNKRANYMDIDSINNPGTMAAIIGLDRERLNTICNEIGEVHIANYNSPNQLVISGKADAVNKACDNAKEAGAKRAIVLNVSGGFHSFLMRDAAAKMKKEIDMIQFNTPSIPIIMNCNALPLDILNLSTLLEKQIESSVYWEDSINYMINHYHIDEFIEIGPGSVLSGLNKKINPSIRSISISKVDDLNNITIGDTNGFK